MSLAKHFMIKRYELVTVVTAMLEDRLNLIEGVRKICALRHQIGDPENEAFMPIRAIESETDHFPLGKMRDQCDVNYLERMDAEMNRYLADAKQDILLACKEIICKMNPQ